MIPSILLLRDVNIFQDEKVILSDVNLTIRKGEFVYLVGKTGSGKSSLLKTIYADLPLSQGEGVVAGYNLHTLKWKNVYQLRRKLGIVFQDFNLLSDRTVEGNLLFVMKSTGWHNKAEMNRRVQEVLELVDLVGRNKKMPFQLSGGEKQRVVIARALINSPQLIIADEATGNLDPETSDNILKLLFRLSEENNTAVLFATHDYRLIEKYPARVITCESGKLIERDLNNELAPKNRIF